MDRAPPRDGSGRCFDSSRAYSYRNLMLFVAGQPDDSGGGRSAELDAEAAAPRGLGYLLEGAAFGLCGSTPRIRPHPMTATQTFTLLRAGADPVIDY